MAEFTAQLTPTNLGVLIERGPETSFVCAILYTCALVYSGRRLNLVYRSRGEVDLPVMLVTCVVFSVMIRFLSFATLAVLALRNVSVDGSSTSTASSDAGEQLVSQHAMAVLFNIGDFTALSTYLLLGIVWLDMLHKTRKHFYSTDAIRRDWLIAYLVLNTAMYLCQIGLYIAVFVATPTDPEAILAVVYAVLGCLNVALPAVLLATYGAYSLMYAGFPYRSREALSRWRRLSRLLLGWSLSRLVWAAASILASSSRALDALASAGNWAFTVLCVSLFLLGELVPFLATCGTDVLRLFGPLNGRGGDGDDDIDSAKDSLGEDGLRGSSRGSGGGGSEYAPGDSSANDMDDDSDLRMMVPSVDGDGGRRGSTRNPLRGMLQPLSAGAGGLFSGEGGSGRSQSGGGLATGAGAGLAIPIAAAQAWATPGAALSSGRGGSRAHSVAASFVSARSYDSDGDGADLPQFGQVVGGGPPLVNGAARKQLRFAPLPGEQYSDIMPSGIR